MDVKDRGRSHSNINRLAPGDLGMRCSATYCSFGEGSSFLIRPILEIECDQNYLDDLLKDRLMPCP